MIIRCVCGSMMVIKSATHTYRWESVMKQRYAFMKNHQPCREKMEKETNDAAK